MKSSSSILRNCGITLSFLTAFILISCGGLPDKTDETASWSGDKLSSEAKDAYSSGDWTNCAKYYETLEGRDPFGTPAQQAQLNNAYCHWKDGDNDAANQSIDRFIRLHPDHQNIDYAYYLKGMINFNDDLGPLGRFTNQDLSERDPKALRDSYDAFKVVTDRFPQSRYAPDAAQRMRYIVNALAKHDVHAARYYYKRGAYIAAVNRAQMALKTYEGATANEEALHLMALSYEALKEPELAQGAERVLAATFPNSRYLKNKKEADDAKRWWQIW